MKYHISSVIVLSDSDRNFIDNYTPLYHYLLSLSTFPYGKTL